MHVHKRFNTHAVLKQAFTIYNFIKMLFELLGGERAVIEAMSKKKQMKMVRESERERVCVWICLYMYVPGLR